MSRIRFSSIILGVVGLAAFMMIISFSFHISHKLKPKTPPTPPVWLIPKGSFFSDTITTAYSHLVTDFSLVQLEGRYGDSVLIEGYQNGKPYLNTEIRNDTLFVLNAQPQSDTLLVEIDNDYPILVKIGASKLQSIHIKDGGDISIPVQAYGSNPNGEIVYKPEHWEKYVLRNPSLSLVFNGKSNSTFFVEVNNLDISFNNNIKSETVRSMNNGSLVRFTNMPSNTTRLIGSVDKMSSHNNTGTFNVDGNNLEVDTLLVSSLNDNPIGANGNIKVKCTQYLKADLLYNLDILYSGDPKIKKTERGLGRVIKS